MLLDERGKQYSSVEFSTWIEQKLGSSHKRVVFLVGGAFGFSPDVYARANAQCSLSRMTFSHQMIRLFFIEQVYRAMTILKGEPYHNE
jgi:23S rRNA (pseudouridine1915-N3)-methyltransferase